MFLQSLRSSLFRKPIPLLIGCPGSGFKRTCNGEIHIPEEISQSVRVAYQQYKCIHFNTFLEERKELNLECACPAGDLFVKSLIRDLSRASFAQGKLLYYKPFENLHE